MKQEDVLDFSKFLQELQRETDRGLPLVAAALIDEKLLATLQSFLCDGKARERLLDDANAPLGTFSARIDACFALGLIDPFEYQEINLIRKVRNLFAHSRHGLTFANPKVESLCANFKSELPENGNLPVHPRVRFINATVCLTSRLYYRDAWVSKEQRKERVWVKPEQVRWRSIAEEPPAPGQVFLGLGKKGPFIGGGEA